MVKQLRGLAGRGWSDLPKGGLLPKELWLRRHRGMVALLWLHAVGAIVYALIEGFGILHSFLEGGVVALAAVVASSPRGSERLRSCAVSFGLLSASAILVHISGGLIEMHFHFFLMVAVISLYQDWLPFLIAVGYVIVDHGLFGALAPHIIYNDPQAIAHPWKWALIHGGFVVGASIAQLIAWKANQDAFHDSLTRLPNRALLTDRIEHSLARALREGKKVAVLVLDVDGFKTVNDSLGPRVGDELLKAVAERLRTCFREADTPARLGGDEFAVLLEASDDLGASIAAGRILDSFQTPFSLGGKEVFATASIGIAVSTAGTRNGDELLRNADAAMYVAKGSGTGRFQFFAPSMHAALLHRLELQGELQRAVANREFHLQYQPMINLKSGRIVGMEALLRWDHPTRGIVPPMDFIPLAEESGLIVDIGLQVLEQASQQTHLWHQKFPSDPPLDISVNLSARQLQDADLVREVDAVLDRSGLRPESLILEITETALMRDVEIGVSRLNALKELGIRIAVDDFGTGYSSLSYLQRFPVDVLKIDRSFIKAIDKGPEESAVAHAVVKLGHTLGLYAVAEGVETAEQLHELTAMGCDRGQGYFFARPLWGVGMDALLSNRSREDAAQDDLTSRDASISA